MSDRYLWYSAPAGSRQVMNLQIHPEGLSDAYLAGHPPGAQEIGLYQWALPPGTYERLRALKQQLGFDAMPPGRALMPGERTVVIGETTDGGKTFDLKSYAPEEVPAAFEQLGAELQSLAPLLQEHPVRAVRGSGAAEQPAFSLGQPIGFRIKLENVGTQPLKVDNPLDPAGAQMELVVVKDKPPATLAESESLFLALTPDLMHPLTGEPAPPKGRTLTLEPGRSVQFAIRATLRLSAGRYRATLAYHSKTEDPARATVNGTLDVDLGLFKAVKPGAL